MFSGFRRTLCGLSGSLTDNGQKPEQELAESLLLLLRNVAKTGQWKDLRQLEGRF